MKLPMGFVFAGKKKSRQPAKPKSRWQPVLEVLEDRVTPSLMFSQLANLALAKTVNCPTPAVGSTVTFSVSVTDEGPSNATGVVVKDLLPAGLTFVSANGPGSYNAQTGVWNVGSINNGVTDTLKIQAEVDTYCPVTNTAQVIGSTTINCMCAPVSVTITPYSPPPCEVPPPCTPPPCETPPPCTPPVDHCPPPCPPPPSCSPPPCTPPSTPPSCTPPPPCTPPTDHCPPVHCHSDGGHSKACHSNGGHSNDKVCHSNKGHSKDSHSQACHSNGGHSSGKVCHSNKGHSKDSHSKACHSNGGHSNGKVCHSNKGHSKDSHSKACHSNGGHSNGKVCKKDSKLTKHDIDKCFAHQPHFCGFCA